ncbi:MAG: YggT family protein [Ilumatobacteraceae bacterium]
MCTLIHQLIQLYLIAIIVRIALSWFPLQPGGVAAQVAGVLRRITDPVLEPLRRVIPPLGGLDLSPLVAIIGIQVIAGLLPC